MFIWTDIETTGLDAREDLILALGLIVTDAQMREVARREWVVHWDLDSEQWKTLRMSDFALATHTKSGLLERVRASQTNLRQVEMEAAAFLDGLVGVPAENIKARPVMAGNSVSFDREFIREHVPHLHMRYNYRLLDVSSFKVLAMATIPGAKEWQDSRPEPAHTPLADLEGSMAELQHWRRELAAQTRRECADIAWNHEADGKIADAIMGVENYTPAFLLKATCKHEGCSQPATNTYGNFCRKHEGDVF